MGLCEQSLVLHIRGLVWLLHMHERASPIINVFHLTGFKEGKGEEALKGMVLRTYLLGDIHLK